MTVRTLQIREDYLTILFNKILQAMCIFQRKNAGFDKSDLFMTYWLGVKEKGIWRWIAILFKDLIILSKNLTITVLYIEIFYDAAIATN